jgi:hypothetical protein
VPATNEIRADYNAQTITIYQAYSSAIAQSALQAGRFVPPFSMTRMTWIKPSFLWLMERSNWGQKAGQEVILAVRMQRSGWEEALSLGILTSFEPPAQHSLKAWRDQFEKAQVHVQWDPERSLRGADLGINSIQVGLSRHVIQKYVEEWVVEIQDMTPLVRKIHGFVKTGQADRARKLLPHERIYPVNSEVAKRLYMKI